MNRRQWAARCTICRVVFGNERSRAGINHYLPDYQRMHRGHCGPAHRLEVVWRDENPWQSDACALFTLEERS